MSLIETLTPKNTEQLRPGLFVQEKKGNYRVVNPIAWEGKWRLNKQFSYRNMITVVIVIFIAWTYFNETEFCRELKEDPCALLPDIINYCSERNSLVVSFNPEVNDEWKNYSSSLQNNP